MYTCALRVLLSSNKSASYLISSYRSGHILGDSEYFFPVFSKIIGCEICPEIYFDKNELSFETENGCTYMHFV